MPRQLTVVQPIKATSKYGFGSAHDAALDLCRAEHGTCPFGCAKDGAPNCAYHVLRCECEPAKRIAGK